MSDFWFWLGTVLAFITSCGYFYSKGVSKGYTEHDWFYDREKKTYEDAAAELKEEIEDLESEIKEWKDCCDEKSNIIDKKSAEIESMKERSRMINKKVSDAIVKMEECL